MKRYFKIFLLNFQDAFQYRSASLVWLLNSLSVPLLMLLYWHGAIQQSHNGLIDGWTYSNLTTYYLLLGVATTFVVAHIELNVAVDDIYKGEISKYFLRPFNYYWFKAFIEIPYRLVQGTMGIIGCLLIIILAKNLFVISFSPMVIVFSFITILLSFFLSLTYKLILGLLAFWFDEIGGVLQGAEILFLITAGFIIPLNFLPSMARTIINFFPFPYMIYYPALLILGKLDSMSILLVIATQILWLVLLLFVYQCIMSAGRKKFTAVGQ